MLGDECDVHDATYHQQEQGDALVAHLLQQYGHLFHAQAGAAVLLGNQHTQIAAGGQFRPQLLGEPPLAGAGQPVRASVLVGQIAHELLDELLLFSQLQHVRPPGG